MSAATLTALMAHCRALCRRHTQTPDAELLCRFARQRDAAAFEELLQRYAPLVWGVCRRMLPGEADREDAFQATFLALVRKPGSVDPRRGLGGWLHTVAVRVARKAQVHARRQHPPAVLPPRPTPGDVADEVGSRELFRAVDEEIERLPALLRLPVLLCCLRGRTRDEAAEVLGCSVAAVKSRLERGRDLLRRRLERRGVELPAAFLVLGLTSERIRAGLWAKTLQSVLHTPAPAVAALAEAALPAMMTGKGKLGLALLLLATSTVGVLGSVRLSEPPHTPDAPPQAKAAAEPKKPAAPRVRTDRYGDPLPPGAVRRFGTLRFRHDYPIYHLAFTPDSKQLIAGVGTRPLAVFDAATGRRLRVVGRTTGGNNYGFALSPDGQRVCCVLGALWELQTGKRVRQLGDGSAAWSSIAFSPDGKIVAASKEFQAEIVLVETATGKQLAHWTFKKGGPWPPQHSLDSLAFSPDGKFLAARFLEWSEMKNGGISGDSSQVWLLDTAKGTRVRSFGSAEAPVHSPAFQPDTGRLATVDKDGAIRFWDVKTAKEVHRIPAPRKDESRNGLQFSADGRRCLMMSTSKSTHARFLTVLDAKDGREVRRIEVGETSTIALSPNGRTIASAKFQGESCVRVWDVESSAERLADAGHRAAATLSLSTDGRTLISKGEEGRVIYWDLRTGDAQIKPADAKEKADRPAETSTDWSRRGPRWRLTLQRKNSEMEVWSPDGSRLLRKAKWPTLNMGGSMLSPDGMYLAVPLHDESNNKVLLWNPEREEEPRKLVGPPASYHYQNLLFTHDSKRLIVGPGTHNPSPPNALWVWDVATAKVVHKLATPSAADHMILSGDDRVLLAACGWHDPAVHIWDMATGKEMATLEDPSLQLTAEQRSNEMSLYIGSLKLSVDERFLAVVTNRGDTSGISVWDTIAWKPVRAFAWTQLQNHPPSMIFSGDGRSLFVANNDSTILEWDVSGRLANGRRQPAGETINKDRLNVLWRTLAETPDKAYPAVWEMLDHAAESVPFLKDKLSPVKPMEEKRVRQLLDRLDSESFPEREEASRQLRALGEQAVPLLRQAIKEQLALETKKRIEVVIEALTATPSPEQQRLLRVLAVLEWSDLAEADEHLRRLADGAPPASFTRAANAALQRRKR